MDHHHHHTTATTTTNQTQIPNRTEADRLLTIAEKLLHSRDLTGSREFALLSQETDPLLEGSDQILAISDVLLASENRVNNDRHLDYYSILQSDSRSEPVQLKSNYRRLALLLHPEKNRYPLSESAFKLVSDAWAVVSDPVRKRAYDDELERGGGERVLSPINQSKAGAGERDKNKGKLSKNFWTACPYCYVMYEYPKVYKECCLRCQNCERAFHAADIPSLPPMVSGKDAYYCCWGFFPLGFSPEGKNDPNVGFPNWMPSLFTPPVAAAPIRMNNTANVNMNAGVSGVFDFSNGTATREYRNAVPKKSVPGAKKRGRPKKNPMAG